jgi:DNA-binding response OmpR family regulator
MKILVVDDDEAVRTGLRCVLVSEGYEVRTACNGREAVQDLAKSPADLVLVDMNMPVQNGWSTIAGLRSLHPNLPIIIITARPDQLRAARAAGLELMEKPLDLPVLMERISALTRQAQKPAGV